MRRFIAYIVMMLTLVGALLFNTQSMLSNKVDAMEFDRGTQLVYSLGKRDVESYDSDLYGYDTKGFEDLYQIDIETKIMDRLKEAGVRDADVKIIKGQEKSNEGYQLKVTLAPLSDVDLNNVKRILVRSGDLTIGAKNDTVFSQTKTGEDKIFADTVAEIVYVSNKAYPAINFNDANAYDKVKKAVDEAENANKDDSSDSDGSESETKSIAYLWMNKTKEDTYKKAYGTDDTVLNQDVKNKVLAEIDLSNYDSTKHQVRLTSDLNGNEFTASSARAFVSMVNAADYGFDMTYLYENKVEAGFGNKGLTRTYIAFGIVLAALFVLAFVAYGLSGITSGVTMLFSVFVSFLLASLLGFEFSASFISGLAVIAFLSLLISANYFERVKGELKKGSDIKKANKDGYHRAWFVSLDVAIVSLVTSILSFLVSAGSLKTFFGVIMIGTIFTFVLTNYFDKWISYWLTNSDNQKLPYFSFFKPKKEIKPKTFVKSGKKSNKVWMIAVPATIAALLAFALPVRNTLNHGNSFFSNKGDYASDYTLNITFQFDDISYEPLSSKDNYLAYLEKLGQIKDDNGYVAISSDNYHKEDLSHGFLYYPETATVNVVEKTSDENRKYFIHYFSVEVNKDLNNVTTKDGLKDVINYLGDAIHYDEVTIDGVNKPIILNSNHYQLGSLKVTSLETLPTHINYNTNNFFLVVFLISVFAMLYTFLRYGLNLALAQLAYGTLVAGIGVALLSILPIPYNSFTVFGILLPVFLANLAIIPLLAINKETIKLRGLKKTVTFEQREEIMNEVSGLPIPSVLFALCSVVLVSLAFFAISSELLGLGIISLLTLALSVCLFYFFVYRFYFFLVTHVTFKKLNEKIEASREKRRIKKNEAKPVAASDGMIYVDQDISHETIIPGLNEFRR